MAVTINGRVIKMTEQDDEVTDALWLNGVLWTGAAIGNTVILTDPVTGAELWKDVAPGDDHSVESKSLEDVLLRNGVRAAGLDGGELFLYYR